MTPTDFSFGHQDTASRLPGKDKYNAISKRFTSQKALTGQNSQYIVILICFCRYEALFLYKIPIYWDYD